MEGASKIVLSILTGILALSILSVILSKRSQTTSVIQASASALSNVIAAATNPVTNASNNGNLGSNAFSLPGLGMGAGLGGLGGFGVGGGGFGGLSNTPAGLGSLIDPLGSSQGANPFSALTSGNVGGLNFGSGP